MNNKKVLALIFALVLLCGVLVSCKPQDDSSAPPQNSEAVSEADPLAHLKGFDFGKSEIVFLVEGDHRMLYRSSDVLGSETAPDLINDAIDMRNKDIENLLNITIKEYRTESNVSMIELVRISSDAGDNAYDVVMPYLPDAAAMIAEGLLSNLYNYDILKFDNKYWDGNANRYFSVGNKLFFATGDMTLLAFDCTHALVFNKTLLDRIGITESPYTLVEQGKWTLDKLLEMAAKATAETDGDGKMTYRDTWGFYVNSNYATSLFMASGLTLTGRDANDMPTLAIERDAQAAAAVVGKIFEAFSNERTTILIESFLDEAAANGTTVWNEATKAVAEDRALFRSMAIIDMNDLADYDVAYGILPTPKINESQDNYYSFVSTLYASCVAIPSQLETKDRSAVVIEAMNAASGKYVKEKYYDVLLKSRRVEDEESGKMLDVIFNNRVYDLGVIYNWGGSSPWDANSIGNFINGVATGSENNFTSRFDAIKDTIKAAMDKTIETIEDL